ncbi:Crp/Fnr family transcriptional regulator [Marinobacter sp. TBZ242]|uniref:Crp/Fnr family transcriptional regulator n=1 Tax=Marinobacter azerbaijanicus TaxID=3050455 RepID=A0ABT7IIR4_9GAMM|nr:Crp/Fnr family transcriptional regulator [Marinobacter sp. TBZ242]MDL0434074.1 Crp/Fnr family transcriptional regulator [Marinobacter sp. TBZ242]
MNASPISPNTLMIRKLESSYSLGDEEKQALQQLPVQIKSIKPGADIVRIGDRPTRCCLILEGFTCVYKVTSEGNRQILALHVPGDMPDLQSLHLMVLDMSIASVSSCKVGFIQHDDIRRICERYPRLTATLWRETLIHASILREWTLNNGQREAYTRIAHLLCELVFRLKAVGLADGGPIHLPITQSELADATGMSSVHMNRVLQALRANGLIKSKRAELVVPDWEKLQEAGEFDPLYLHMEESDAS